MASRPCPACGDGVDPLRAAEVVLLSDGFRYLCSTDCRTRFVNGERAHEASRAPSAPESVRRDPRTGIIRTADPGSLGPLESPKPAREVGPPPGAPWAGIGLAAAAIAVAPFASIAWAAIASAVLSGVASAVALASTRRSRHLDGALAWATAPLGAALAAVAGLLLADDARPVALAGAGFAALAMVVRGYLALRAREPVDLAVTALARALPSRVRVPVAERGPTGDVSFAETRIERVHTGEELLVVAGEVVAVDGVVQAGEAMALLHPGARTPVRRTAGDSLLAGSRIAEGALRILATRVGDDRALCRPGRVHASGVEDEKDAPSVAGLITRWAKVALVALAAAAAAIGTLSGSAPIAVSSVAAVLLSLPLLAIRRAAVLPRTAAAATACERGIVFRDAAALERAGRVTVAALCTRGTVTNGDLSVVEVHLIGQGSAGELVAFAAAAEAVAETHPIAIALRRYAEERHLPPESVRRAVYLPGRGVTALASGGEQFVVGSRRLLLDEGVSVAVADADAARIEARGHTALFVGLGGRVRAVIALEDSARPGARAAVQRIFDLGSEVVLLSGDHRATVETLARSLDVANVRAELVPEERGSEVERLRETGGRVAAVGRPGFDDAALAAADVAIVLGAAGNAQAERAVALTTEDVRDAAAALWIARAARVVATRTALVATVAGLLAASAAAIGVLSPWMAAIVHVAVDAYALPSGARLLRRIELRLPART